MCNTYNICSLKEVMLMSSEITTVALLFYMTILQGHTDIEGL